MSLRRRQRGAAATMTIVLATIFLGFLMGALFQAAKSASRFNDEGLHQTRAKFAALAAINRAFAELNRDPGWRAGWPNEEPLHQNPHLRYKLKVLEQVEQSRLGTGNSGLLAGGADEVYLLAQGFTDAGAGKALAVMGGTAYRPGAAVAEACYATGNLVLVGGSSDGFDSRIGDHWYNPGELDTTRQTLKKLSGHVGGGDDLRVDGTVVDGNVVTPDSSAFTLGGRRFGSSRNIDLDNAVVRGSRETPNSPREVAEVAVPFNDDSATVTIDTSTFVAATDTSDYLYLKADSPDEVYVLTPGAYKSVEVPLGKTLELHPGDYYVKETFALDTATVTLGGSGTVRFFVGEEMNVGGSTINPSSVDPLGLNKKPADLQFLFADKKTDPEEDEFYSELGIRGSSVNAVFLGCKLRTRMKDTQVFGTVQADTVFAENCDFHYDLALESLEIENFSKWKMKGLVALPSGTQL